MTLAEITQLEIKKAVRSHWPDLLDFDPLLQYLIEWGSDRLKFRIPNTVFAQLQVHDERLINLIRDFEVRIEWPGEWIHRGFEQEGSFYLREPFRYLTIKKRSK